MLFQKFADSFFNLPLRAKLILSFLLVICFGGILSLILGIRLEHRTIINLAKTKVKHDLSSAWMVYNDKLNSLKDIMRLNASRESIQQATLFSQRKVLEYHLSSVRKEFGLDILTVTDENGYVILRTTQSDQFGDSQTSNPLIRKALNNSVVAGTEIIPRKELLKECEILAKRAYMKFVPTPKAATREENYEENGMMLLAAVPIKSQKKDICGVLYGGILLNRNFEIVDRVKEIVFKGEKYKGADIGTATIFQNDLRISTNVRKESGERALGTRVSKEVNQAVLVEGRPWIERAFVVNDWYISAYEPIRNIEDKIIGILYVGMLEKPYIDLRNKVMMTFTGIAILCVILLLVILFFITSSIIHPIQGMVVATNKIARGDLSHKVNIKARDEIGQLAHSFNQMTEELQKANEKLIHWGKTLEKRVEERTRELRDIQDSLIQSEKLASMGKMAAGVAHEINNPLTSILINTHLMLEKNPANPEFSESLKMIAEETSRCTDIVKGLLEFSRQNPPKMILSNANDILTRTLRLLENQASFQNIKIIKELSPELPRVKLDEDKIEQVFWNLIFNAAEAMPNGGLLKIQTKASEDEKYIEIRFEDTGGGIPENNLHKLFDPFFTTKSSGTGLGLAVAYGIIDQHHGKIDVKSKAGQGSTFTVHLPL